MRNYDYRENWKKLLTPQVVRKLITIHEYRGEQRVFVDRYAEVLTDFMETAKIQSTESSNRMEGIKASDERLKKIVLDKTMPKSRMEREIAGYRDVLNNIQENSAHIPIRATFILQLHRDLFKYENGVNGGIFKNTEDMEIPMKLDDEVDRSKEFHHVSPQETPESVDRLCEAYRDAIENTEADPLLLMSMFILDFLCIHPFQYGNGRMSRLLALLLLYKSDYIVGKYSSVEKLIEGKKDAYYTALQKSSVRWDEEENDYEPFVNCMLSIVMRAYAEFSDRTRKIEGKKAAKPNWVEEEIRNTVGTVTKTELMKRVTGVSQTTIQRTLTELVKQKKIRKIGNGRYTKYEWNREDK